MTRISYRLIPLFFIFAVLSEDAAGQAPTPAPTKEIRAVRAQGPVVLDGKLDDAAWSAAPVLGDLTQKQPNEGAAPTEATELRFVYDDEALYVGARMHKNPGAVLQAPVSRRDAGAQAEHLWISLDTYLDRRTAYSFGITAAGSRMDWYHATDDENDVDLSFDPVWEAEVSRDSGGWTAEMRIPFSQLRFGARPEQVFGLNVDRWNPATQEDVFWIPIPSQETAWASRMGRLVGITGVRPSRRLEILPYVASGARLTAEPGEGNPFDDGSTLEARAGADLKVGLGPNLTLEATVNPDFGQVEQDPAEVNLSAFETFFAERRPFFIEGSQLLQGRGPSYFYSRRIGAQPVGAANGDFVDYPNASTILGAAKLTGRLSSGTSLGVLAAATQGEDARIFDVETGEISRVRVAPFTGYAVARAQQEFGADASTVGLLVTGVRRDLDGGDPLSARLHRQAFAGGADWNLRFRRGEYSISGALGASYVEGDSLAILRTQRSSARYFQRPDAGYVEVDSGRTSLAGYAGSLSVARNNGKHWLWSLYGSAESPGFEVNDAGAEGSADDVVGNASVTYRETRPGRLFQRWDVSASSENLWNFGGVRNFAALRTDMNFTFRNFWRTVLIGWVDLRAESDDLAFGGPLVGTGQAWRTIAALISPPGRKTRSVTQIDYGEGETGHRFLRLRTDLGLRPGPRWSVGVVPSYRVWREPRQFAGSLPGGTAETYGRRYVFSSVDRRTLAAQIRLSYLFTPDLSLEVYAEPFAERGRYADFGELPAPGRRDLRFYGEDGPVRFCGDAEGLAEDDPCAGRPGAHLFVGGQQPVTLARDYNVRSFRSNAVLRWEWRPGSTLFVVWQQDRAADRYGYGSVAPGALFESFDAPGDHSLAVKLSYWLPVR